MRCVLIELNHKNIKYTKTESCSSITYALSSSPSSHFVRFLYFFTLVITSTSVCVTLKKLFLWNEETTCESVSSSSLHSSTQFMFSFECFVVFFYYLYAFFMMWHHFHSSTHATIHAIKRCCCWRRKKTMEISAFIVILIFNLFLNLEADFDLVRSLF